MNELSETAELVEHTGHARDEIVAQIESVGACELANLGCWHGRVQVGRQVELVEFGRT